MNGHTAIVIGGAGFIGSHLTERLLKERYKVIIVDNFSSGKMENIRHLLSNPSVSVVEEDLKKPVKLREAVKKCDIIFHLAANPEVRMGKINPKIHFKENILTTFNLLEAVRQVKSPRTIVFTSTSTVYGEASLPFSSKILSSHTYCTVCSCAKASTAPVPWIDTFSGNNDQGGPTRTTLHVKTATIIAISTLITFLSQFIYRCAHLISIACIKIY